MLEAAAVPRMGQTVMPERRRASPDARGLTHVAREEPPYQNQNQKQNQNQIGHSMSVVWGFYEIYS